MYYSIPFLFYQLQLFSDRRLFDAFVTQTSIAHLTKEKLEIVPIFDIELNEQQRIAERLSAIDAKIADELAVVAKYRKVKAGLMARLLTPPPGVEIVDGGVE
jgi:type I restriction enzyme S subunit